MTSTDPRPAGHQNYRVTVTFASPIAAGQHTYAPTLDTVLMGILSEGAYLGGRAYGRMMEQVGRCVQIADGLPSASCLWPAGNHVVKTVEVSPRTPRFDQIGRSSPKHGNRYQVANGPYVTKMAVRAAWWSEKWAWNAVGDPDETADILERLTGVGARRGSGFGAVTHVAVAPTFADETVLRRSGHKTGLARPVPVRLLDLALTARGVTQDQLDTFTYAVTQQPAWPNPAWGDGPYEPVAVPILESAVEVDDLTGATERKTA